MPNCPYRKTHEFGPDLLCKHCYQPASLNDAVPLSQPCLFIVAGTQVSFGERPLEAFLLLKDMEIGNEGLGDPNAVRYAVNRGLEDGSVERVPGPL
jgi:hypothetical protein